MLVADTHVSAAAVPVHAPVREPRLPKRPTPLAYATPDGRLWARSDTRRAAALVRLANVDQGTINDCFLAATMGALALQQPERFAGMVRRDGDEVEVQLPERTVRMSPELPFEGGQLAFAGSGGDGVLWPAYVEKAVAMTRRAGYHTLDQGGPVVDAFRWLTGTTPREVDEPGDLLADIRTRMQAGEAVVLGSRTNQGSRGLTRAMRRAHLYGDHCYVVTGVHQPRDMAQPVVELWNIWGTDHPRRLTEHQLRRMFDEVVSDREHYWISR